MFPNQQQPNDGQPPTPYQPPQGGVNSTPVIGSTGQYDVLPPLQAGQNNGHSGHNPYEFIVNPNMPKKSSSIFGGGNSFLLRIALIGGGAVVLLIIAATVISALGPKSITPGLTAIAQRQQEIIRVATAATQQATDQDTKNFASNVELGVTSSQQQLLTYMQGQGTKLKPKVLALDQSAQTDTLLTNAASANTYDGTVTQTLTTELQAYQGLLQTTFKQATGVKAKQLLQNCFTGASELVKQAKSLPVSQQ